MKLSEIPLMTTVLCKHAKCDWSEIFEITKFAFSKNGIACYIKTSFGMQGREVTHHAWRDVTDLDASYVVIDFVG